MKEFTKISKSKYEEICKEACENFTPSGNKEMKSISYLIFVEMFIST